MNLEDLAIGWREAVLGVVVLLALYVVVVMLRLRRLKRLPAPVRELTTEPSTEAPVGEPAGEVPVAAAKSDFDFPWNEPPDAAPAAVPLADAVMLPRLQSVEAELGRLRAQVADAQRELVEAREELATVRGELAALRDETSRQMERVQATQHVAPIYGDAMQMAIAGYDAATIAERCGVARAEAELVVALIRNRDNNDNETMRER